MAFQTRQDMWSLNWFAETWDLDLSLTSCVLYSDTLVFHAFFPRNKVKNICLTHSSPKISRLSRQSSLLSLIFPDLPFKKACIFSKFFSISPTEEKPNRYPSLSNFSTSSTWWFPAKLSLATAMIFLLGSGLLKKYSNVPAPPWVMIMLWSS